MQSVENFSPGKKILCNNNRNDSSSMISTNNVLELYMFINKYLKGLESFYNITKLALNHDSTKLISCKGSIRENTLDIKLNTTNYIIEQSSKVKVLGTFIISGLYNGVTYYYDSKVNYHLNEFM